MPRARSAPSLPRWNGAVNGAFSRLGSRSSISPTSLHRDLPQFREIQRPSPGTLGTIQTVALNHDGWQIRIVAVPESGDRREQLKATGGYAFTHVGQLTRVDDSAFSVEQAKDILESLRQFLSFARGAACALPIHWGRGEDDEIVWRRFQSPIVDPWQRSHLSWLGEGLHTGPCGAVRLILRNPHGPKTPRAPGRGAALVSSLQHDFERLGRVARSRHGGAGSPRRAHRRGSQWVDVSRAIRRPPWSREAADAAEGTEATAGHPAEVRSAEQVRPKNNDNWDSCQALAELRNGFVHAKEERRRIVFGSDGKAATPGALQLSLWYQELALLRLLEYRGSYFNRTTATWVGQVEPVPWSEQ